VIRPKTLWLAAPLILLCLGPAAAQERQAGEDTKKDGKEKATQADLPKVEDKLVTTQHRATIGGKEVRYTATAGTLVLREEDGKPRANIFFVAYTRDGVQDRARRPVTFTYNGGPGSSSVWLHMGAFGPRRVEMGEEGTAPPPPYRLVDNGESLLDVTDLVFIDPVTTGYSRAVPGEDPKKFYGIKEDAEAVAEFIRLWTTRFNRWSSPKFLAGESYGTTRSARLSNLLQSRHGMYLNGIILLSSILNFQTARFAVGNDLPYPLFLPTYTATAWYHKRLPQDLQAAGIEKAVDEARRFAAGEYTLALMQGNDLTPEQWNDVAAKVARYTGLSPDYVKRTNLRPEIQAFCKELLRDQRTTVGRLDSRFKGMDRDAAGEENEFDPSYAAIQGPFTAVLNDYVRQDLGFQSDLPYEILTDRVRPWSYGEFENQYANVAEDLRRAMSQNPALKVFVGNGYYDLATPFFATEYTFDHLGFEPDYKRRVSLHYYQAGHMMYIRRVDHEQLKKDIAAFIAASGG
jgi:carboxypeptidase C (cathepsin A)